MSKFVIPAKAGTWGRPTPAPFRHEVPAFAGMTG
ncbi:MAG: hypothetical protein QOJ91_1205 [Sphingomonadales bacterium]|jgi:hypothetical protein|nr:hypothetical protein [Sphingomonadales bacterium]